MLAGIRNKIDNMRRLSLNSYAPSIGLIGMGAFGSLVARHLAGHFDIWAHDPKLPIDAAIPNVTLTSLKGAACRDVVIVATPVSSFESVLPAVAKFCRPDALIMDVGSVKVVPADLMLKLLPETVDIVATHPLFGPQSARDGLSGLKIAICPLRSRRHRHLARFLHDRLGLEVILTTPEEHDRETAIVQGLTHLIGKVILDMGPLPTRMTTRSFELLVESISMVKDDAPEVFDAIETTNPFSEEVRVTFFDAARRLSGSLRTSLPRQPRDTDLPHTCDEFVPATEG